jgi:hypothetical protein
MDMTKEALEYVVELGNVELFDVNGQKYSTQKLHLVPEATPAAINVRSLSGLVQYLKSGFDGDYQQKLMVHVVSPMEVVAFSTFNRDLARNQVITAKALLPEIRFGQWTDTEQFIITLQAAFVPTESRSQILKIVGNLKEENVQTYGDDGVSQSVTAKVGITTVEQVAVPNPVTLQPFRTFVEVDQPASEFVFRMKNGPLCALFEADGGAWKLEAMQNIEQYLTEQLTEEIAADKIVIIA